MIILFYFLNSKYIYLKINFNNIFVLFNVTENRKLNLNYENTILSMADMKQLTAIVKLCL